MSQCIKNGEGLISKLTQSYDGMLLSNKKALTTKQNKTKLMVRKHQGETSSALGWAWESSLKGCTSHELTHVTFWKRLHALYRNRKHIGAAECWQWGDRADYSGPTGMFRGGEGWTVLYFDCGGGCVTAQVCQTQHCAWRMAFIVWKSDRWK